MDAFGAVAIALSIAAFLGAMVGFWALSKKCPPGVVLGVAIALYILARVSTSLVELSRIGNGVVGTMGLIAVAGFILGVIDLRRLMGNKPRNKPDQNALLRQTMGPKATAPKPKGDMPPARK